MKLLELFIIAVGLSMDAFAVSICTGLSMKKSSIKKALIVGLYFGIFQAVMPLIGYFLGSQLADRITAFDHWIAFLLLAFIGGKMIVESFHKEGCADRSCPDGTCKDRECPGKGRPDTEEAPLTPAKMLPLAVATSIDALAVGVSFAFLKVNIGLAATLIGITTLAFSVVGVKIGKIFGSRFKSRAELTGGIILVFMGLKILLEHIGILHF